MRRLPQTFSRTAVAAVSALALSAGTATAAWAECSGEANYTVTFNATWDSSTTNHAVPGNAHWSPMVVATHATADAIYAIGDTATQGIKVVAETGKPGPLKNELSALFKSGEIRAFRTGKRIGSGTGKNSVTLSAASDRSLLTMISMIAPSPDWVVGVSGFDLCTGSAWVDSIELPLMAQDAGTDDGVAFASPNKASAPAEVFQYLDRDLALTNNADEAAVFGTLMIKRN